ncbi:MAG TPA: GNAT family N-acetyltransferase [Candidatus Limnocylindrales bacterium]|nr:GNAT family N-acetyltransferase [Candidatus Limnocylindrales bacterium]
MEIIAVTNENERLFWNYVNRDRLNYFFFIVDWTQRREQTKIWLATEGEQVLGSLLVFADSVVQLRGSREAVKKLLERVEFDKVDLQAPLDCEDFICERFKPRVRQDIVLMRLNRGEEHIQVVENPVRLSVDDADEISSLLKRCNPERWDENVSEKLRKRLRQGWENTCWLGITREKKLVSVGYTSFELDFAANIGIVATDENYRGKGYATSIVSALVQEIFQRLPVALIHVIADNAPAVRAYSKVGFKSYRTYLSIRS